MFILSSTFTADPIKKTLISFLGKFDLLKKHKVEVTSYNQIFQELRNHNSITSQNVGGINIFAVKPDDFLRFQKKLSTQHAAIDVIRREMLSLASSLTSRAQLMDSTFFIIAICHATDAIVKKSDSNKEYVELYNNVILDFKSVLTGISNVYLIFEQDITQVLSIDDYYDPIADDKGHIPFVLEYYYALGYLFARKIFDLMLLAHTPLKAIILDCDNTLWQGICGEVGAEKIEVTPSYQFIQQVVKKQKEHGVLLCLCSKNNEKDVLDVFNCKTNGMLLKLTDVAAYKINWNSKSSNIRELLDFLGYSEQNVVFIDDKEDECFNVQKNFPNLLVIQLPEENNIFSFFNHLWVFDHIKPVTNEDKNRTTLYQQKLHLNSHVKLNDKAPINQSGSDDTIVNLVELTCNNLEPSIIQRIADLTTRTNQFNLAKRVYSESQINSFVEKNSHRILLAYVKDNRGNEYGLTGLAVFSAVNQALLIDTFLLSCRVIGKNVEWIILDKLVEIAKQNNLVSIDIPFISTARNKPAEYFLESIVDICEIVNANILAKKSNNENLRLYSLAINHDSQIRRRQPVLEAIEHIKADSQVTSDSYNAAVIDIAKNHKKYLNALSIHVTSAQNKNFAVSLLDSLNNICGKKIPLTDTSFIACGINSFELMMLLARIYRHHGVKVELLDVMRADNILAVAKMIRQKTRDGRVAEDNALRDNIGSFDSFPLSVSQEALWLEKLKTQNDLPYNLFRVFHISGKLDLPRLETAFKSVIAKHESLRMAFAIQNDSILPICKVFDLEAIDCKLQINKINASRFEDVSCFIHSLVSRPFDLESPPLIRVHLVVIAPNEFYLVIIIHHIICDGWSFSKLIDDITNAYNNKHGEPIGKFAGALPYNQFVNWQQEQIPLINAAHSEFLQKHFLHYPRMNLPYDFDKPKVSTYKGQHISFELDEEIINRLHGISLQCKTTLYETMLSIYMIFLAKICDQTSISCTSVITTRPEEYFDTIGYMVNLVALRSDVSSNPDFLEFLAQTRSYFQKIRQIGNIPFLEIIKKYRSNIEDIGDLNRIFFVFENFPTYKLSLNNLQVREVYCGNYLTLCLPTTSKFDLAFYFKQIDSIVGNKIAGVVEFSTDVFKLETIKGFVEKFIQLVKAVVENIDQPILSYSILTNEDQALITSWNMATKRHFPREQDVLRLFLSQVHLDPQKIALVEESGQTVNYSELNRKANIYASYLHSMGINKNDVVAISLNRSIDMIAILLAVIKLGAIYLAIDPNSPVERRKYLCEDAKVKLHIDQLLNIPHAKEKLDTIDQFRAVTDAFYIVYTSGSTGKPKGVRTTSLAFCNLLCWFTNYYNISCDTRSALVVSEGFDAFGWQLWPYLACGATVYLVSKKTFLNVGKFIEFINTNNISMCFIPTAYVEILINENYLDKIKTLQYLFTGGDRLNTFLPKPYPFKVMNHYGVSEGAVVSTFCEVPVIEQGKSISEKSSGNKPLIGKPIDNTEIYILDAKRQPVPIGIWGELCIGGLGVSSGYINDSILSAHKFVKKNFSLGPCSEGEILYLTGDRARFLNDGNIEYLNRLDNQIEIHGYRIEPAEIENLLLENAKINQAAVVLHEDNESKQLIAYVVLKNNIHDFVDTDTLIDNLKNKLSLEMIPKHIVILDKLPVTENGKIDRLCLAKKPIFVQGHKNFQNVEIANKLYGDILDIFSKLLGIPQESLNIDKSFFELGGDSIGALKLLNIIKKEFNVSVPISDIYANSSNVSSLVFTILKHRPQKKVITKTYNAKTAADSLNNSYDLVATLRSGDNSQPLFFIHPAGGTVFVYQKLISLLDKNQTCYGIQYPLDEKYEFNLPKNIQELAAFYVDLIRHVQPRGPYAVIGYSFGGMLAYEIAYQLYKSGQKIAMIGILDTLVVSVLDQRTKQKLKHNVIQNYEKQYEETFVENPMAETTFMHMQNIGFAYQPPCFAGEIDLFKAKAQAQILIGIQDDTNFWSRFSKVNVHYVPGNHDTILEKENVEQLASELAACITSAKIKGARL